MTSISVNIKEWSKMSFEIGVLYQSVRSLSLVKIQFCNLWMMKKMGKEGDDDTCIDSNEGDDDHQDATL